MGSTTFHLAAHLKEKSPLTIYTNSLAMIAELSQPPDITIYILGGSTTGSCTPCRAASPSTSSSPAGWTPRSSAQAPSPRRGSA